MTADVIRQYFIDGSSRISVNSRANYQRTLRKFHIFLKEKGITETDFKRVLSFPSLTEHKIKKTDPHSEIAAVLSIIDRASAKGKRDYALILLAVVLGLRAIDIVELTFDEIDWSMAKSVLLNQNRKNPCTSVKRRTLLRHYRIIS